MVADQVGVVRVVRDEHDAEAGVTRRHDVFQNDAGLLDAERGRRLVEDDDLGAEVDGSGDGETLLLPAREATNGTVEVGHRDAHLRQFLVADGLHALDVERSERALRQLVAEEEVAPHRLQRREREILVNRRDTGRERLAR